MPKEHCSSKRGGVSENSHKFNEVFEVNAVNDVDVDVRRKSQVDVDGVSERRKAGRGKSGEDN